ncbi:MAG: MFS transporter [Cyclobacteriaceae bacterium]
MLIPEVPSLPFFAGMMVLQLLFVVFMMPETKNKSLEELEEELFPKGRRLPRE